MKQVGITCFRLYRIYYSTRLQIKNEFYKLKMNSTFCVDVLLHQVRDEQHVVLVFCAVVGFHKPLDPCCRFVDGGVISQGIGDGELGLRR